MKATPWVISQVGSGKQGRAVDAKTAAKIINRSKNPVIVVGAKLRTHGCWLLDRIEALRNKGIPVVATSHSIKFFIDRGYETEDIPVAGVIEVTNMLRDPDWQGFNGMGRPDLVAIAGVHLDLTNQTLQTLKNFSEIETLTLGRYFMANANYSFPNMDDDIWMEFFDELVSEVKERE